VERVPQDAARPLVMAADGGVAPDAATRAGNAAVVEAASDLLGAVAARESGENLADHLTPGVTGGLASCPKYQILISITVAMERRPAC
jgi:hypothetical protein